MLHTTCSQLLDDIGLIHKETFMMHLFDDFSAELPPFKEFLEYKFHDQMTYFITALKNKSVQPYRTLIKELFSPTDRTNKSSTICFEKVAAFAIKAYRCESEDPKKATRKYISAFGSDFSYDHCSNEEKNAMMGKMAVNDLAKSSFAGVTAQLQVYGRVGMHSAAAVSDIERNRFLDCQSYRKKEEYTDSSNKGSLT
jgi:hypothetical protein